MLEEQEHWETFLEKREHLLEAWDAVRSAAKLEAFGEALSQDLLLEQRLDLCRALYRLHFQVRRLTHPFLFCRTCYIQKVLLFLCLPPFCILLNLCRRIYSSLSVPNSDCDDGGIRGEERCAQSLFKVSVTS